MPTENKPQRYTFKGAAGEYVYAVDFDRVTAERDALQQRLNAADQRVDELHTQLAEAREVVIECLAEGELPAEVQWKAERISRGRRLYVDGRALSSSAEPAQT